MQQYSLDLQYQLTNTTLLELGHVGHRRSGQLRLFIVCGPYGR